MFKGKKGLYILIPLNILIWGYFAYRFYSLYNPDEEPIKSEADVSIKLEDTKDSACYKLQLTYDDPFLKTEPKEKMVRFNTQSTPKASDKTKETVHKKPKEESEKNLPVIKYLGLVKNNTNGFATAIVSINGSSKLIKQDETIDGMRFKDFTNENLTVVWKKEKILITK